MYDLYKVNNVASWAKSQLSIIADMIEESPRGQVWIVKELRSICDDIETVAEREIARESKSTSKNK